MLTERLDSDPARLTRCYWAEPMPREVIERVAQALKDGVRLTTPDAEVTIEIAKQPSEPLLGRSLIPVQP
jgi:hypothetical protein